MTKLVISIVVLGLFGLVLWRVLAPEPPLTVNNAQPIEATLPEPLLRSERSADAGATTPPTQAELALLDQASSALDGGEVTRALGLLEQHRGVYPNSALVDDRVGLEVLASCMKDRAANRERGRSFLLKHPNSPIVSRLWRACQLAAQ